MQTIESTKNVKITLGVGIADSANLITIFTMFLWEVTKRMLEETAKFVLFPVSAAGAIIEAVLAWRQKRLDEGKNGTLAAAIVKTAAALAITIAVIGALAFSSVFATVSPIIFTATLAVKTLFHYGAAAYYWWKSAATQDPEKRAAYRAAMQGNAVGATALTLATLAVSLVMIALKPIMAIFGIVAGVIAGGYSIYKLATIKTPAPVAANYQQIPTRDEQEDSRVGSSSTLSNSAQLRKSLSGRSIAASTVVSSAVSSVIPEAKEPTSASGLRMFDKPKVISRTQDDIGVRYNYGYQR